MLKSTPRVKQAGEQSERTLALRSLFEAEEAPLLRYAFSLTGRRAVAEEIVQEVFLRLHSQWEDVKTPRAWLFRSTRNESFNYLRKNKREVLQAEDREPRSRNSQSGSSGSSSSPETPESLMQRMEAIGKLREIVEELSETDRQIVKLKYFDNLKYREISEKTGLTIGNVGYRLHHILKELGEKLRPLGIDEQS